MYFSSFLMDSYTLCARPVTGAKVCVKEKDRPKCNRTPALFYFVFVLLYFSYQFYPSS